MSRNVLSLEQVRELASQVVHSIPVDLPLEVYNYWMSHGKELNVAIAGTLRRNPLLLFITTVDLPAIDYFSAKDHFREGETAGVRIGWIGKGFKKVFLTDDKVETNVPAATLQIHQLLKPSLDGRPTIEALGGEEEAETTLAQMWEMMKKQGQGQEGNLLVDGHANIFYIRDAEGELWAVHCYCYSDCAVWNVEANPVTFPAEWDTGDQVISR